VQKPFRQGRGFNIAPTLTAIREFSEISPNKSLIRTLLGIEEMLMGTGNRHRDHERTHLLDAPLCWDGASPERGCWDGKSINDMGLWRQQRV
jgi:hypothetical protein